MNKVKSFEEFDRKVKEIEKDKIRTEEQLKNAKLNVEKSLEELKQATKADSIQGVLEYMKNLKEELGTLKKELDTEIENFNNELEKLDTINKEYGE